MKKHETLTQSTTTKLLSYTFLALLFVFALPFYAHTQPPPYTTTHDFGVDMKEYTARYVMDPMNFEDVIYSGTVFDYPTAGRNVPHHILIDAFGGVLSNQAYDFSAEYKDIRSVDIAGLEPIFGYPSSTATYYHICLARPDDDPTINTTKGVNDRILIIPVHNSGGIMPGTTPYSIKSANDDEGLYPLGSYYDNVSDDLYVCGYITDDKTYLPSTPGFTTYGNHRKAFVLRINNPNSMTPTVTNTITIDTDYPIPLDEDYDIAMRITPLINGNLHITGSVNNVKTNGLSPTAYKQYSATMNIVLDPALNYVAGEHYGVRYDSGPGTPVYSQHEYGTALMEDNAGLGVNSENYIMSNYFVHQGGITPSGPYPIFFPQPTYMHFTHVNSNASATPYMYNTGQSRAVDGSFNAQWGLQHSYKFSQYFGGGSYLVAGMTIGEYCGATGASFSNVLPFLMHVNLWYTGSNINLVLTKRVSYQTASPTNGTGPYPSATNSYPLLGGGLSNWAWNPTFCSWTNGGVSFSAPRYTAGNLEGLKTVKITNWGLTEPTCGPSSYIEFNNGTPCEANISYEEVEGLGLPGVKPYNGGMGTLSTLGTLVVAQETPVSNFLPYSTTVCSSGSPNYKNGNTTSIGFQQTEGNKTSVYPNPASTYIQVAPSIDIAANKTMVVKLYNMMGALITTLYNGNAASLAGAKLSLPQLSTGMYYVQVQAGEKTVLNQKILIQQ